VTVASADKMEDKHEHIDPSHGAPPAIPNILIKPQSRKPHDSQVTFEEYHYYALRTREEENAFEAPKTNWKEIVLRKKNPNGSENEDSALQTSTERKFSQPSNHLEISDEEWTNASRAFRTASWGACECTEERMVHFDSVANH
jgi:hypothetical protein